MNEDELIGVLEELGQRMASVANAITTTSAVPGTDETGGHVECLTEAVMGVTCALTQIGGAMDRIAEALEEYVNRA